MRLVSRLCSLCCTGEEHAANAKIRSEPCSLVSAVNFATYCRIAECVHRRRRLGRLIHALNDTPICNDETPLLQRLNTCLKTQFVKEKVIHVDSLVVGETTSQYKSTILQTVLTRHAEVCTRSLRHEISRLKHPLYARSHDGSVAH